VQVGFEKVSLDAGPMTERPATATMPPYASAHGRREAASAIGPNRELCTPARNPNPLDQRRKTEREDEAVVESIGQKQIDR